MDFVQLGRYGHCVCIADGRTQVPGHYCLKFFSGMVNGEVEYACEVLPLSLDDLVGQLLFAWYKDICLNLVAQIA